MFFRTEIIKKILRNRKKLETKLKVKIQAKESRIELEGDELNTYIAEKVFDALDSNFSLNIALLLAEEEYLLEDIPIKRLTNKNLKTVRARIIGTKGKTLKLLSELSDCYLTLHDNTISIIGSAEKIKETENALKSLILGSKQSNVFKYLEKHRKKPIINDLGIKE